MTGKWKVKRAKGESFTHKLTKEHTFRNFNQIEKASLLALVLVIGFFAVSYGYYTNVYQTQIVNTCNYGGIYPNCTVGTDPFSILYNGTILSSGFIAPTLDTSAQGPWTTIGGTTYSQAISVTSGDVIVANIEGDGTTVSSVTDSQSNTWTDQTGSGNPVFTASASSTGTDTVTVHLASTTTAVIGMQLSSYKNVGAFGAILTGCDCGTVTSYSHATSTVTDNALIVILGQIGAQESSYTPSGSGQSNLMTHSTTADYFFTDNMLAPTIGSYTTSGSWSSTATILAYNIMVLEGVSSLQCPSGYGCVNSYVDSNKNINLASNSTNPAIALSKAPVDLSTCSSKECLIYESWRNSTTWTNSKPFAMYLTLNQTLPTQSNYDPLQDKNVALIMICYPQSGKIVNCYLYEAKTQGQSLLAASGESTDPGVLNCSQTSVIYGCLSEETSQGSTNFYALSTVLNYTGASDSSTTTGHSGQAGTSFFAMIDGIVQSINLFSGNPGVQPPLLPCADADSSFGCGSYTLPFLNINGGPYYIGFYSSQGQNSVIQFGTSYGAPGTNAYSHNANTIWYWIPTVTTNVQGTTDTGGFFGFLGHVVGSAFSQAGNFLGDTFGPALNVGGSIMGAVLSAFVQAVAFLIQTYRVILNVIGNLLGLGNIGDTFVAVLTGIGNLIVSGFSAVVGFFTGIGSLISSGYFTFLAGAAVLIGTLLPIAIGLWLIIFNGAFTVTDIIFFDYVVGIFMVFHAIEKHQSSLKAFLGWVQLNIFIFTFIFTAAWTIFDIVTRPIHRTKETVDPVG